MSGRPAEQRDAEHALQIGHMTADGRGRQVEMARCGGEASSPRDLDEGGHGDILVHRDCPSFRDYHSRTYHIILKIATR
jgi:hypothetical protein